MSQDTNDESDLPDIDISPDADPYTDHKFHNPSKWDPKHVGIGPLDAFCRAVKTDTARHPLTNYKHCNLSPELRKALEELSNNPNVIIKPALLSDQFFYQSTPTDLTDLHNKMLHTELKQMVDQCQIRISEYQDLWTILSHHLSHL